MTITTADTLARAVEAARAELARAAAAYAATQSAHTAGALTAAARVHDAAMTARAVLTADARGDAPA